MKQRNFLRIVVVNILCILIFSLPVKASEQPVQVAVSIPPQVYFIERIGGDLVEVMSMLGKGGMPHTYEPTPQQMRLLSDTDMYVRIHVDFENAWWEKMVAANPGMYVVDSTEGVEFIETHDQGHEKGAESREDTEEHHDKDTHMHHGQDPHIWLSPRMVKIQAENICQGLINVDPAHQTIYQENKEEFLATLDRLDSDIQAQLTNLPTRKFMVFHPAWSYFAREYELEEISIEIEGKEPSAREMTELMKFAQKERIAVVFIQPQTSRRSVDTIAKQIGADVKILDPLAADWMENMRYVTKTLAENLSR